VISEDELFGLKIQEMRLFEDDSDGLFVELLPTLIQMFNDFEMNLLMFQQKRLYLVQCLNSINRKDFVKEFDIAIRIVLKSLLVDLFE
jgi:hypothetical protein